MQSKALFVSLVVLWGWEGQSGVGAETKQTQRSPAEKWPSSSGKVLLLLHGGLVTCSQGLAGQERYFQNKLDTNCMSLNRHKISTTGWINSSLPGRRNASQVFYCFYFFYFYFFISWLHLRHMEVPRPGTEPVPLQWSEPLQSES